MWHTTYPWESPRRKTMSFFFKSFRIFLFLRTIQFWVRAGITLPLPFCFLLKVKEDLNGLAGYISVSFSLLKSSSISHNQVVTTYTQSYFFHLWSLVILRYCQILFSRFGGLATTPVWSHRNNFGIGVFWVFFPFLRGHCF